uniref:Uncharacterized protein n=1 Tax=Arundo donax TaxID=35708 RepID=A0A0A8YCJ7_ARUDO
MDKVYNLCRVYEFIRIDASSVLGNGSGVVSMITLLCVSFLGYKNRIL